MGEPPIDRRGVIESDRKDLTSEVEAENGGRKVGVGELSCTLDRLVQLWRKDLRRLDSSSQIPRLRPATCRVWSLHLKICVFHVFLDATLGFC